jgi:hypothetical protein
MKKIGDVFAVFVGMSIVWVMLQSYLIFPKQETPAACDGEGFNSSLMKKGRFNDL